MAPGTYPAMVISLISQEHRGMTPDERTGFASFGLRFSVVSARSDEHRARPNDALLAHQDVAVRKRQPASLLLNVDMRSQPVTDLRGAGVVQRQVRRDQVARRVGGERHGVAQSNIG